MIARSLAAFGAVCVVGCALEPLAPPEPLAATCADRDGDGHHDATCGGDDCADDVAAVHPGAAETPCNGRDDDCDPTTPDDIDADGDGVSRCDGDCDDGDDAVSPRMLEIPCNGVDDDCDPDTPDDPGIDADGDGFTACRDCRDTDAAIHPEAAEACGDLLDRNCDGVIAPCPVCGNGVLEAGEACDDGNTAAGDGCRADCRGFEVCGDGLADLAAGEHCDPPQDGACMNQCSGCRCPQPAGPWRFDEVSAQAGLTALHGWDGKQLSSLDHEAVHASGGIAAGDFDDDGDVDVFTVGGEKHPSLLWINLGNGSFAPSTAGIDAPGPHPTGPLFADLDGDGADDLLIGGVAGTPLRAFVNQLDGTFAESTAALGLAGLAGNVFGGAAADVDRDGDLDLFLARWGTPAAEASQWFAKVGGTFVASDGAAGLAGVGVKASRSWTFAPNFADLDGDGWLDLLVASDFGTSRVLRNNQDGTFSDATTSVISDENGMGASVGDLDGDGDLDWFVTSIWDPNGVAEGNWGVTGNRLYANDGAGNLSDVTGVSGLAVGWWGWGSCLADFNADGHLDVFHVNGFGIPAAAEFFADPSVLFLSNGDGTFTERAWELGIVDLDQGRGVVCFDYDGDGDIDIAVANNRGPVRLYANNGAGGGHTLEVALSAPAPNARAIGALVRLSAGGRTQLRIIAAGNNFVSQNPVTAHFGLGAHSQADAVEVTWPDGSVSHHGQFSAGQRVTIVKP